MRKKSNIRTDTHTHTTPGVDTLKNEGRCSACAWINKEKEKYWIAYYNSVEEGYNTKDGGQTIVVTDKFLEQCGSYPFYAFDLKGNKLGEFLNQREFSRQYGVGKGDIYRMLHNQAHYCNGVICIDKETFTEKRLQECIKHAHKKTSLHIFLSIVASKK